ncbi:hypothetical protein MCEGEM3_01991 [Oxalobacteraceae bacterium]
MNSTIDRVRKVDRAATRAAEDAVVTQRDGVAVSLRTGRAHRAAIDSRTIRRAHHHAAQCCRTTYGARQCRCTGIRDRQCSRPVNRVSKADVVAAQGGVHAQHHRFAVGLRTGRGDCTAVEIQCAAGVGSDAGQCCRTANRTTEGRRARRVHAQLTRSINSAREVNRATTRAVQRRIRTQRHRFTVSLCAGRGDRTTIHPQCAIGVGGHAGQRCRAANHTTEGGCTRRIHAQLNSAIDGVCKTDCSATATGECRVNTEGHFLTVALRSRGRDRAAIQCERATGVGGDTRRRQRTVELRTARGVQADSTQRVRTAHCLRQSHIAKPRTDTQIASNSSTRIQIAQECNVTPGTGQRYIRCKRDRHVCTADQDRCVLATDETAEGY